jgi:hypothetical protein
LHRPDAARFGTAYLSKFGWDPSKGLGTEGDGRTSHLKVAQKLDMLGIGAAHTRDPNGIAWKQASDFERLLARLNGDDDGASIKVDGFARATEVATMEMQEAEVVDEEAERRARKERKREQKKKRKADEMDGLPTTSEQPVEVATPVARVPPRGCVPSHHWRSSFIEPTTLLDIVHVIFAPSVLPSRTRSPWLRCLVLLLHHPAIHLPMQQTLPPILT